jgi:hypothetical protein
MRGYDGFAEPGPTIRREYEFDLAPLGIGNQILFRLRGLWYVEFILRFIVAPTSAGAPSVGVTTLPAGATALAVFALPLNSIITLWSSGSAGGTSGSAIRDYKPSAANPNVPNALTPLWYQWLQGMYDGPDLATSGFRFDITVAAFTAGRLRPVFHMTPLSGDAAIQDVATPV